MSSISFAGLASGIDSKSLIDALVKAKESVNAKRQAEIDHLTGENSALEDLNSKLLGLDDLISPLRTANSGGISKKGTSSDPTVANAVVGANANNASYTLTVTSTANSATGSFNQTYSDTSSYVSTSGSGNATITVGTGADQVVVTVGVTANSTTVQDFVNAINDSANASGRVAASAVNVGTSASPSYQVVLTTLNQGTAKGTLAVSADVAITELQTSTIDQATNAIFSISGITGTITRSTNSINDVISGITFNLLKSGTSIISVSNDADTTADKIGAIINAYNDIVKYVNNNNTVEQDSTSNDKSFVFGSLAKTRIDDDFLTVFRDKLAAATSTSGTTATKMSELGISTNRDGTLTFDSDVFKTAVSNDPVGAGEVLNSFADSLSGVEGSIYSFTQLEGLIDISVSANDDTISNLEDAIAQLLRSSAKYKERLTEQFTRLEKITGQLQTQQQALSGILHG